MFYETLGTPYGITQLPMVRTQERFIDPANLFPYTHSNGLCHNLEIQTLQQFILTMNIIFHQPVWKINGGPIDNVFRKSCWSTGIWKAVDRLVYRKSYKVKGFITFGLCFPRLRLQNNRPYNFEIQAYNNYKWSKPHFATYEYDCLSTKIVCRLKLKPIFCRMHVASEKAKCDRQMADGCGALLCRCQKHWIWVRLGCFEDLQRFNNLTGISRLRSKDTNSPIFKWQDQDWNPGPLALQLKSLTSQPPLLPDKNWRIW